DCGLSGAAGSGRHRDYLKSKTMNRGDGSPFVPVGLSGLAPSRQAGKPGTKLFALQEQLVWKISIKTLFRYTEVLVPSFVCSWCVASIVHGRPGSLSSCKESTVLLVSPSGKV